MLKLSQQPCWPFYWSVKFKSGNHWTGRPWRSFRPYLSLYVGKHQHHLLRAPSTHTPPPGPALSSLAPDQHSCASLPPGPADLVPGIEHIFTALPLPPLGLIGFSGRPSQATLFRTGIPTPSTRSPTPCAFPTFTFYTISNSCTYPVYSVSAKMNNRTQTILAPLTWMIVPFPSVSSALSYALVSANHRSSRATKVPPPWHRGPHPHPLSCRFTDALPELPHTYLSSPGSGIHVLVPEAPRLLLPGLSAKLVNSTHCSRPRSGFGSPPGGDQPHGGLPAPETWKTRLRTSPLLWSQGPYQF